MQLHVIKAGRKSRPFTSCEWWIPEVQKTIWLFNFKKEEMQLCVFGLLVYWVKNWEWRNFVFGCSTWFVSQIYHSYSATVTTTVIGGGLQNGVHMDHQWQGDRPGISCMDFNCNSWVFAWTMTLPFYVKAQHCLLKIEIYSHRKRLVHMVWQWLRLRFTRLIDSWIPIGVHGFSGCSCWPSATVTSLSQQMGCMGFNASVNLVRLQ